MITGLWYQPAKSGKKWRDFAPGAVNERVEVRFVFVRILYRKLSSVVAVDSEAVGPAALSFKDVMVAVGSAARR